MRAQRGEVVFSKCCLEPLPVRQVREQFERRLFIPGDARNPHDRRYIAHQRVYVEGIEGASS